MIKVPKSGNQEDKKDCAFMKQDGTDRGPFEICVIHGRRRVYCEKESLERKVEELESKLNEFEDREAKGRAEFRQLWGPEDNLLIVARKLSTWRDYVKLAEKITLDVSDAICTRMTSKAVQDLKARLERFWSNELVPIDRAREAELEATVMHLHDFIVEGYGFGHVIKYRAQSAERWFDDPNMDVKKELLFIASECEKRHAKTTKVLDREESMTDTVRNKLKAQGKRDAYEDAAGHGRELLKHEDDYKPPNSTVKTVSGMHVRSMINALEYKAKSVEAKI